MGAVWIATNLVLENQVAIKVLHRDHAQSDTAEARLLREARAAAQIGHQNIIQVFDFGKTDDGFPFIVMELLQGEDLGAKLDRLGRLGAIDSVRLMLPVVSAVAAAHLRGIVHRDLKPQNIFIAVDASGAEIPKVVDFGVAKIHEWQHTPKLTLEGRVVGSPEYLSPEQARGQDDIDSRSDVWALCVTLYEMVTGDLPFRDESYNRLLRKIIEDDPEDITAKGVGDEELWQIIRRGMAKARQDRWQSASELGEALSGWVDSRGGARISTVRFSQPDTSGPGQVPPTLLGPRRDIITARDAPAYDQRASRPSQPRERGSELSKTSPDRFRRARTSRLLLLFSVAGLLALAGSAFLIVSMLRHQDLVQSPSATTLSAPTPVASTTASPAASALPLPPAAPDSAALDPSASSADSTATAPPAPVRIAPTRSNDKKTPPARTAGAPPIPTEPNF